MTCQEFKDSLDRWLLDRPVGARGKVPAPLAQRARECSCCAQTLQDWFWLADQTAALPAPQPSPRMASRVTRAVARRTSKDRPRPVRRSMTSWQSFTISTVAIAASIAAIFLLAAPRSRNRDLATSGVVPPVTAKPAPTAQAPARPAAVAAAKVEPLGPPLPVSRALRDSTGTLVNAGMELSSTIRPITRSAAGAFGFLWIDATPPDGKRTL